MAISLCCFLRLRPRLSDQTPSQLQRLRNHHHTSRASSGFCPAEQRVGLVPNRPSRRFYPKPKVEPSGVGQMKILFFYLSRPALGTKHIQFTGRISIRVIRFETRTCRPNITHIGAIQYVSCQPVCCTDRRDRTVIRNVVGCRACHGNQPSLSHPFDMNDTDVSCFGVQNRCSLPARSIEFFRELVHRFWWRSGPMPTVVSKRSYLLVAFSHRNRTHKEIM